MPTILCIDPNPDIRRLLVEELQDHGFDCIEAENGASGLETALNDSPDLIICDLLMPVMSGSRFLIELHQRTEGISDIPVIITTGFDDEELTSDIRNSGVAGFLSKPIEFSKLLDMIERILGDADVHLMAC